VGCLTLKIMDMQLTKESWERLKQPFLVIQVELGGAPAYRRLTLPDGSEREVVCYGNIAPPPELLHWALLPRGRLPAAGRGRGGPIEWVDDRDRRKVHPVLPHRAY
jgi:hypothetical protein